MGSSAGPSAVHWDPTHMSWRVFPGLIRLPREERIEQAATTFLDRTDGRWLVCWTAGSGVVGTDERLLELERGALAALLRGLGAARAFDPSRGAFVLASSAGGIYAGGTG